MTLNQSSKGNLLVTGGSGYIGSHFCKMAARAGYHPVVIDRLQSASPRVEGFRRHVSRFGNLEVADIGDSQTIANIIRRYQPVAAVCFAALIEVGESMQKPDLYWENNFIKMTRFLRELELGGVRHVVFSSTAAVYGKAITQSSLSEDAALAPINPYGAGKLAVEIALQGLMHHHEASDSFIDEMVKRCLGIHLDYPEFRNSFFPRLKSVCFRYFNAAGADDHIADDQADDVGLLGEMHEPETHLIPNTILAALGHNPNFTLNGTDYPTKDGTCIRDYVHVNDLASAHLAGLEYLQKGGKSDVFNLGSGSGYSNHEIINTVRKITQKEFPVTTGPRRAGDPPMLVANSNKAKEILGWQPHYSLDKIIATALRFHQSILKLDKAA
jgi:UDP-glucose 4-epimerase